MNLYLLTGTAHGYDVFDSCVVCAESEGDARVIYPHLDSLGVGVEWVDGVWVDGEDDGYNNYRGMWGVPEEISVEYIGIAAENLERGCVLASFNAG